MRVASKWATAIAIAALMAPVAASAQTQTQTKVKMIEAGGYLISGFALDDWSKIAGFPLGFQTSTVITPDASKPVRIRSLFGLLYNFSRTVNVPQQNYGSPNDLLQLTTKNTSLLFGIGPEFGPAKGESQPFLYGTVGFDTYWTSSNLAGTVGGQPYSSNNGDSRIGFAWAAGLGFRKSVSHGEKLEVSAEYRSGSGHRYLNPDQITTSGTSVIMDRAARNTNQIIIRIGSTLPQY